MSNRLPSVGRVEARTRGTWRDEVRGDYASGKSGYRRRVRRMERRNVLREVMDES